MLKKLYATLINILYQSSIQVLTALRPVSLNLLSSVIICLPAFIPALSYGQAREDLRTLFFEGVYLEKPDEILLSSGAGNDSAKPLPAAMASPARAGSATELFEDIQDYENSISNLIENGGAFESQLAQEYLAISALYQQAGDFENAVQALENTMHIERVNQGLYTLAQTDAIRQLIQANKTIRNFSEADQYHEYLYYLMSRNLEPGSEALTEAALEWAEWNVEAYRRLNFYQEEELATSGSVSNIGATLLRRGELVAIEDDQFSEIMFIPRAAFFDSSASARLQSFTAEQLIDPRLKRAEKLYDTILESDPDNIEVLGKKANITHLYKIQLEKFIGNNMIGSNIRPSSSRLLRSSRHFRRIDSDISDSMLAYIAELENADDPEKKSNPETLANAYIQLADWNIAFENRQKAEQYYNKARDILLANDYSEEEVTAFISPEPALFIPEYITYPDTRSFQNIPENMDIPYIGYIDVSFNKQRSGNLRNIRIENFSEDAGNQLKNRLMELLRSVKVRPLFVAGEVQPQSDIKVRYYYTY